MGAPPRRPPDLIDATSLPLLITPTDGDARVIAWVVAGVTAGLASARFVLDGSSSPVGWVLALAAVGFFLVPSVVARTQDRRRAMGLIPSIGLVAIGIMGIVEGGLRSEAMYWLPLVPIIGAVTRGPGSVVKIYTVGGLLLVAGLTLAEGLGVGWGGEPEGLATLMLRGGGLGGALMAGGSVAWALDRAWRVAAQSIADEAATHPITGLPSRKAFDRDLAAALARSERTEQPLGVAYLDLDGFKRVNDLLGHQAGDELLQDVAKRLQRVTRAGESPYHLAGDEFALILEAVDPAQTERPAERLVAALTDLRAGEEPVVEVTASLGLTVAGRRDTPSSLVARADHAMYSAKRAGGGRASVTSAPITGPSRPETSAPD